MHKSVPTDALWLYPCELERDGHYVRAQGQLVFNSASAITSAVLGGLGLCCVPRDIVETYIADGILLASWTTGALRFQATISITQAHGKIHQHFHCGFIPCNSALPRSSKVNRDRDINRRLSEPWKTLELKQESCFC
jgi:hypothetical protein